jgi:hypothetical protein
MTTMRLANETEHENGEAERLMELQSGRHWSCYKRMVHAPRAVRQFRLACLD